MEDLACFIHQLGIKNEGRKDGFHISGSSDRVDDLCLCPLLG